LKKSSQDGFTWDHSFKRKITRLTINKKDMNTTADIDAPVYAAASIDIRSNPSTVWKLISKIPQWPEWASKISSAEVTGEFRKGTDFRWKSNGMKINSTLQTVDPEKNLSWTGKALWIHAEHIWELQALPDGGTRVTTAESMDGFLIRYIYSSEKLLNSLQTWLKDLKSAAESQ
jgi:hypothetical protein